MKPETALDLVGRYSRLTRAIKDCKKRIGGELDKCKGLKGFRLETVHHEAADAGYLGVIDAFTEPSKRAQADQNTHLSVWYAKEYGEWEGYEFHRFSVGGGDEAEECPHCYAAHQIVQERKLLRHQLAAVKAAMTRGGS